MFCVNAAYVLPFSKIGFIEKRSLPKKKDQTFPRFLKKDFFFFKNGNESFEQQQKQEHTTLHKKYSVEKLFFFK